MTEHDSNNKPSTENTPEWVVKLDHIRERNIKKRLHDFAEVPTDKSLLRSNEDDVTGSNTFDFEVDGSITPSLDEKIKEKTSTDTYSPQQEIYKKLYQRLLADKLNEQADLSKEGKFLNEADYIEYQKQILDSGDYQVVSEQRVQVNTSDDLEKKVEGEQDLFQEDLTSNQTQDVTLQIIMPTGINHQPIRLINEHELEELLYQKLIPHIQDAVTGMLKVAIQKQAQQMIQSIHQEIDQDLPELLGDLLHLYIKEVLNKK